TSNCNAITARRSPVRITLTFYNFHKNRIRCSGTRGSGFCFKNQQIMNKVLFISSMVILSLTICAVAQTPHKGVFRIYEPGYYQNTILKGVENYESRKEAAKPKPTFT